MREKTKLKIGEFSKMMQVTVKTLRHYEQKGLLFPCEVDEWTGYRYYNVEQMQRLGTIRGLQRQGFTLEEIKELLEDGAQMPSIDQLTQKIEETERQLQLLMERRSQLLKWVDSQKQIKKMEKFSIQSLPEIIVASHREVIPNYAALGPLCVEKSAQKCNTSAVSARLRATASPLSTTKSIAPLTLTSSIANRWKRWAQTTLSYNSSVLPLCLRHYV